MKHYNHKRVIGSWYPVSVWCLFGDTPFDLYKNLLDYPSNGRFYWPNISLSKNVYFEKLDDAVWYRLSYGNGKNTR